MIEYVDFRADKERRYTDIQRSELTNGEYVTIHIDNGNEEMSFRKYLPAEGKRVSLDITPYCRAVVRGTPVNFFDSGDKMTAYYDNGMAGLIQIEYGDEDFASSYEPYGSVKDVGYLTKLPYFLVSRSGDSVDPIIFSIFTWDDDKMTIYCGQDELEIKDNGNNDTILLQLDGNTECVEMSSLVYGEDIDRYEIPVRIVPRGMNTRRLIWRNEMGGYDAWCFEFLRESNFATSSEVFYSSMDGYTRTNRKSERLHTVETRELDDRTAEVVAYVMASPEVYVWDYESEKAVPIDIVTEECRTYSDTELSGVQVSYRKRKRE